MAKKNKLSPEAIKRVADCYEEMKRHIGYEQISDMHAVVAETGERLTKKAIVSWLLENAYNQGSHGLSELVDAEEKELDKLLTRYAKNFV